VEKFTYKYGLNISTKKTKAMAFKVRDLVRSKIVIKIILQNKPTLSFAQAALLPIRLTKILLLNYQSFSRQRELFTTVSIPKTHQTENI
jgi:hypothetical protein